MDRLRAATQALQPDPFADLQSRARFEALNQARSSLYERYQEQRGQHISDGRERFKNTMADQRQAADRLASSTKGIGRAASRDVRTAAWADIKEQRTATVETLKQAPRFASFDTWMQQQGRTDPTARAIHQWATENKERKAAAKGKIDADRASVAHVLASHPHPDPASRDPRARGEQELDTLIANQKAKEERAQQAEANARAAFQSRTPWTWCRNVIFGSYNSEQHRLVRAMESTAAAADCKPDSADVRHAREHGASLAYAAQRQTAEWEQRPDVAQALENQRLNTLVDAAAAQGDPQVSRALRQGDPEQARQVIHERQEAERRRIEMQQRMGIRNNNDPGMPGPKGPR